MRKLHRFGIALTLTLVLCTNALAGIIDTPPAPAPPPEPPAVTATGITDTPPSGAQSVTPATDPVVDLALNLLQSVLSLF